MPAMLAGTGLVSFFVALVTGWLLLSRFGRFALDQPNARSLHERPVPRTGGLAVLAGVAASSASFATGLWLPLGLAAALAAVSMADDLRGMPTAVRLAAHLAAAAFLAWYVLSPMHPVELLLIVLAIGWITNLYNFMDGSDGLAGGMAVIGFAAYATAAGLAGRPPLAATSLAIAAAALGFLVYNFHPARIFLGDVGSIPLGFLAGALGVVGWRDDVWPLWFPVLVFGPFVGDATLTLLKRAVRRDRMWLPHKEHYYQRLVRMGFGHRGAALIGYAAMLLCAAAALFGRGQTPVLQATVFAACSLVLAASAVAVDLRWRRFAAGKGAAA
jgi:UDP-N-acetylmuramyl pentapeptide phosphotransferase/UDP-N-acetylglucosamine-1-phosphate transferase